VRLSGGSLGVAVAPLGPGERFRVVVGDAEVEVHGTSFEVTARDDRLVEVRVLRGRVAVRSARRGEAILLPGERWEAPPEPAPAPASPMASHEHEHEIDAPPRPAVSTRRLLVSRGTPRRTLADAMPFSIALERRTLELPAEVKSDTSGCASVDAGSLARVEQVEQVVAPAEAAFEQGFAALRSGEPAAAALLFDRAVSAAGGAAIGEDASYWRAVALGRAGRALEAARALQSFLDAYPASNRAGEAAVMLGRLFLLQGDGAGARRFFEAASRDPAERIREAARAGLRRTQQVSFTVEQAE